MHHQGSSDGWHLVATPRSLSITCVHLDGKRIFSREDMMGGTAGNQNKPFQTHVLNGKGPAHPGTYSQCWFLCSAASATGSASKLFFFFNLMEILTQDIVAQL